MKGRRKFLLISCFFVVDILLVVGIVFVCSMTLTMSLEKEINSLSSLTLYSDRFNTEVKSVGNYSKIEEAIKSYLDDYALNVQNVLNSIDYQKLDNFSSDFYYLNDISVFNNDLVYLNNLKQSFNYDVNLLLNNDDKAIYDYVYNYINNDYFVKLYNDLIDENIISIIKECDIYLEFKKVQINAYIDSIYNYVNFLEKNSNNYFIVEGNIQFNNSDLEIEYFELIEKVKESKV